MTTFDPFLIQETETDLPGPKDFIRGQYDYAQIRQPDGSRVGYVGPSTVMGQIESGIGLLIWQSRHLALGVAKNDDISHVLRGMEYDSKHIDRYVKSALDRVGASDKANVGTALHRFLEPDYPESEVPEQYHEHRKNYHEALRRTGLIIEMWDRNVVSHRYRVAGTADLYIRCPQGCIATIGKGKRKRTYDMSGKLVIGDVKTGSNMKWVDWSGQTFLYAVSNLIDVTTDEETEVDVSLDAAIIVLVNAETGVVQLKWVDLHVGAGVAELALLKHAQGSKAQHMVGDVPDAIVEDVSEQISFPHEDVVAMEIRNALTRETLMKLWNDPEMIRGEVDKEVHREQFQARWAELA